MSLFDALLVAHLLGDWVFQTEWQARTKEHNWAALLSHVLVYHLFILGACLMFLPANDRAVYLVVGLLALTHALLDRRRVTLHLMRLLHRSRSETPERWLVLAFDQSIHVVLLGLAALALTRGWL